PAPGRRAQQPTSRPKAGRDPGARSSDARDSLRAVGPPPRHSPGRAEPGRGQRSDRCCPCSLLSANFPDGVRRRPEPRSQRYRQPSGAPAHRPAVPPPPPPSPPPPSPPPPPHPAAPPPPPPHLPPPPLPPP